MTFEFQFRHEHPHGTIVGVSIAGEPPEDVLARLHPEERAVADGKRGFARATWVAGRLATAEALRLNGGRGPVLADDRGAPQLPAGFVGSISHKSTIAVALVAPDAGWRIGVDVELVAPERSRVARIILRDAEREALGQLPEAERWPAVLAHFSMKEAIYKALDPYVRRYVAYQEAEIGGWPVAPWVKLELSKGEGPFAVELTCRRTDIVLSSAKIRPA